MNVYHFNICITSIIFLCVLLGIALSFYIHLLASDNLIVAYWYQDFHFINWYTISSIVLFFYEQPSNNRFGFFRLSLMVRQSLYNVLCYWASVRPGSFFYVQYCLLILFAMLSHTKTLESANIYRYNNVMYCLTIVSKVRCL